MTRVGLFRPGRAPSGCGQTASQVTGRKSPNSRHAPGDPLTVWRMANRRRRISEGHWRADGRQIYFMSGDTMMAQNVEADGSQVRLRSPRRSSACGQHVRQKRLRRHFRMDNDS